jgi:lipopolysaccharide export LptBFGC system permease protein LptF
MGILGLIVFGIFLFFIGIIFLIVYLVMTFTGASSGGYHPKPIPTLTFPPASTAATAAAAPKATHKLYMATGDLL